MILHVQEAKYLHDYVVWLRFNDGAEGEVDLARELDGEVFGPLKDPGRFKAFRVDPFLGTIVWSNGADLAPEFLYDNLRVRASGRQLSSGDRRARAAMRRAAARISSKDAGLTT